MPKLAFHIEADYQKVIKLREEIDKLKSTISGMDGNTSPATFRAYGSHHQLDDDERAR